MAEINGDTQSAPGEKNTRMGFPSLLSRRCEDKDLM